MMKEKMSTQSPALLSVLAAMFLLVIGTENALAGAAKGLDLFLGHVLPSTFPFLVFAALTGRLLAGRETGRRGILSALLVGNLSGYPAGGRLCGSLVAERKTDFVDRFLLSMSCIGAGPGFTLAAVGTGILGSPSAGRLLYAAQLLTSLTAALPLLLRAKKEEPPVPSPVKSFSFSADFVSCVKESCQSMLYIGGYVILFSCLLGVLEKFVPLDGIPGMVVAGILEVSNGCGRASLSFRAIGFALLGGLLGFGGLSVFCQLSALTLDTGIQMKELFLSRLLAGLFGGGYALLLYLAFPSSVATIAYEPGIHGSSFHPWSLTLTLCLLVVVLLLCDRRTADLRLSPSRKGR